VSTLGRFLREFLAFGRGRIALATGLLASAALIEGLGLLVMVEVVRLAGLDVRAGALSAAGGAVATTLRAVGIEPSFGAVLLTYVGFVAGRGAIERAQTRLNQQLEAGFVASLRGRLYRALTFADWTFHVRHRTADAVHALTHEADRAGAATYYLLQMIGGAALATTYLALALWASPFLTLVVVAAGLGMLAVVRRQARAAIATGEAASASTEQLYRAIAEHLSGMKTAKSYGTEDRHVAVFEGLAGDVADVATRIVVVSAGVRQRLELASVTLLAVLLYVSRERLQMPVGETLVLVFLFARLMPRLNDLLAQGTAVLSDLPAFTAITSLEDRGRAAAEMRAPAGAEALPFETHVRLEAATFAYDDRVDAPAVASVDLQIPAGRTVAIVGSSGAGKSTIADLIMGLLRPAGGRLTVDGIVVDGAHLAAWRRQIGYVAQDTFLFHDSVRANLVWAAPDAAEADLWQALGRAAAADFVRAMPRGLDTVVGDRGVRVSGGERQRLALARALLRRPRLLILDEATSALDAENETSVLSAIASLHGRLAILVITHRLSAVRGADTIYVLDNGRVVEDGSWGSLVQPGTRFRRLCDAQGIDVAQRVEPRPTGAGR
jgi:ATP-binding cassette subfamily C protein